MQKEMVYFCRYVGATAAAAAAVGTGLGTIPNPLCNLGPGFTQTPVHTGAGVYTITLSQALPIGEYEYIANLEGAAANGNAQVSVAGAVVTVSTSIAAVATDENFSLTINRIVASQP